ncbi:coenzyme F420-0:L-glutamate ligase [Tissierella carlieri]|uniref:Coenzyme F420-0:L-glutamate ligase n=1 Tax=Tissierella carlieri TaxID=689904 RepID=A0ABT1SAM6_9FIRM|nr:coenzyme F420-0:L-glutamate ligase [Tissierella carlieri]MCQ4923521.1 coenzyme F420-0:L-glutamate ligase [Tissierella carlieri]
MVRTVGTTARGIRTPIVKKGDDLVNIVVDSLLLAANSENFHINDRDVLGITESLLARAQGNYATADIIGKDIESKFPSTVGLVFPILSRNRFSIILKGIISSGRKVVLLLSYPSDEVGNHLMDIDKMDELKINPYIDVLTESDYRKLFGEKVVHPFTGVDYVNVYKEIGKENIEIIFSNDPRTILNYTKDILVANVHDRHRTKRILKEAGANLVYGLDDILNSPIDNSGYNPEYGVLGSNLSSDHELKLFPRDCQVFVESVQNKIKEKTGKNIEVMIYGDGAFKDPVGKIWELADPVVSPGYTKGLEGTPNELKLKYIVDTELDALRGDEVIEAVKKKINTKNNHMVSKEESLGTTPRRLTDLLGSLCDLTSGSGDKGTPVVLIQGYFDNYATE